MARETLRLDLDVPDDLCCICRKIPAVRLLLEVASPDRVASPIRVSVCRDCLAEYAPEALAAIEEAAGL